MSCDKLQQCNTRGVPEGKKSSGKKGTEKTFEEIMTKIFPKSDENYKPIGPRSSNPSRMNIKKTVPRTS